LEIIAKNLEEIKVQINSQNKRKVKLIAVSKYSSVEEIKVAYALGVRDFGENKVQDAFQKAKELSSLKINWHFLGHLQTNKVKQALKIFDWIHSVDSLKLLALINKISQKEQKTVNLCFQIKLIPDQDKYGLSKEEFFRLLTDFLENPKYPKQNHLKIQGLMTILPLDFLKQSSNERIKIFSLLEKLKEKTNREFNLELSELSMGMSNDYQDALKAGATMLRIGSALFKKQT